MLHNKHIRINDNYYELLYSSYNHFGFYDDHFIIKVQESTLDNRFHFNSGTNVNKISSEYCTNHLDIQPINNITFINFAHLNGFEYNFGFKRSKFSWFFYFFTDPLMHFRAWKYLKSINKDIEKLNKEIGVFKEECLIKDIIE